MGEVGKYCKLRPDGSLAAGSAVIADNGYAVKTEVVGTPEKFSGEQNVAAPPSVNWFRQKLVEWFGHVPIKSENLGADGVKGAVATESQSMLRRCDKKFPSLNS